MAMHSLIQAKLTGGKSAKPSLMNNQTVLQIRQTNTHTNITFIDCPALCVLLSLTPQASAKPADAIIGLLSESEWTFNLPAPAVRRRD
jgi:hypothetical protein